jgi:hypothetical protein
MTSTIIRERELAELLNNLDTTADIVNDIRDDRDIPIGDLNWAASIIVKAADFVAQSLQSVKDRRLS